MQKQINRQKGGAQKTLQDFIGLLQRSDGGQMDWTYLTDSFTVLRTARVFLASCAAFAFMAWTLGSNNTSVCSSTGQNLLCREG